MDRPIAYRLDEHGEPEPLDMDNPQRWSPDPFSDPRRRVGADRVGGYSVSTVFLSIDHAFHGGPPVLWETMVFGDGEWSDWQDRYTSRADAEAGHARVVEMIRRGESPPG